MSDNIVGTLFEGAVSSVAPFYVNLKTKYTIGIYRGEKEEEKTSLALI